jgi:outer membrane protein assembly factor BamB
VYCIDAYTGQDIWTFTTNEPKMTTFGSTPAVVGDRVIIGPDDGNMYCLDTDNGNELWSIEMGPYRAVKVAHGQHNIRSSPIIYNNRIYVGSCHDNTFYCVDLTGHVLWSYETGGPILGSAAIEDGYVYIATWGSTDPAFDDANNMYKFTTDGTLVMKFPIRVNMAGIRQTGGFFGAYFATAATKTPIVKGDRLYWGVDQACMAVYDATNGDIIFLAEQPYVAGENSHGSCVVAGNRIFSQAGPTMAALQADLEPTIVDTRTSYLGGDNPWYGETIIVEYNETVPSGQDKSNLWSAWGGWEIFSSAIFSGIGNDARVYCGSESYGMTCWRADDGMPLGWYTTQGGLGSSPAIWDGKLYFGSQDNNVYCFEDHTQKELSISISADTTAVNVEDGESVSITLQLTGKPNPDLQYTEATSRGAYSGNPPLADKPVIVTFTDPDGNEINRDATTDEEGMATVTYTPTKEGTWKVISWFNGEHMPTYSYTYAFSDEISIAAGTTPVTPGAFIASLSPMTTSIDEGQSVVLTASVSGGTAPFTYQWYQYMDGNAVALSGQTASTFVAMPSSEGTYGYFCEVTDAMGQIDATDTAEIKVGIESTNDSLPMEYIYAIVAVIAIVIIAVVAYMYMKKRK